MQMEGRPSLSASRITKSRCFASLTSSAVLAKAKWQPPAEGGWRPSKAIRPTRNIVKGDSLGKSYITLSDDVERFSLLTHSRYPISMQLRGCGTALVTPFRQDGSIDDACLRSLISWQIDSGIDFLVPCGTTGETPTLTHDEWLSVVDVTIEAAGGRVPIMAGATSNNTHEAVAKSKEMSSRSGVDYILTAT